MAATEIDPDLDREQKPDLTAVAPAGHGAEEEPKFGGLLVFWMGSTIVILALLWMTGFARTSLVGAVEAGAARAEWRFVGEVGDDLIRKAVRTQHDTLTFWTTLTFLGQFLGEPALLAVRALAVATAFAASAALFGRPIGYDRSLYECTRDQGYWVLGIAVRASLMMILRREDVSTSAVLALPAGAYPAWMWLLIDQLDLFALVGWTMMGVGGVRRGQVGVLGATVICLGFWAIEAGVRVGLATVVGSAMRLSLLPG